MKKGIAIFMGALLIMTTLNLNAQSNTGVDFFKGKWTVVFNGTPRGDIKMVVDIDEVNGSIVGTIKDSAGNEMYKVTKTEVTGESATLYFIGSQGNEVYIQLQKKDDNHLDANSMNMFGGEGVRIK